MGHMHCSCVSPFLLGVFSATLFANAWAKGTFADLLASRNSTAAAALGQLQSSYQYADSDSACLLEYKFKNCRSVENTGWSYFE